MFEGQRREDIENLIDTNSEFRRLYKRHQELDHKVQDAEGGRLPMNDLAIARIKRQKLQAKDRLQQIWDHLRH